MIRFEPAGVNEAGEKVWDLVLDGQTARKDLTMDQVVEAINRRDEERLGWDRVPGGGNDGNDPV